MNTIGKACLSGALAFGLLALGFLTILFSCSSQGRPQKGLKTLELRVGAQTVIAELALSPEQQQIGLMHRKALPDGRGMLFVFDRDRQPAFWMKNTLIPLSIAYIARDGTVMDIFDMEPLSEATVASSHWVRYALEVPVGFFQRAGLAVGDLVKIPQIP